MRGKARQRCLDEDMKAEKTYSDPKLRVIRERTHTRSIVEMSAQAMKAQHTARTAHP